MPCRIITAADVASHTVNVTVGPATAIPMLYGYYFSPYNNLSLPNITYATSAPDSAVFALADSVPMMDLTFYASPSTVLYVGK